MATNPGLLTDWPWKGLGNLKYVVLAPWVARGWYVMATAKEVTEMDVAYAAVLPLLLLRMLHNQAWITVSRLHNARGKRLVVDRGIEFDQVDRERNWDDDILLGAIMTYLGFMFMPDGCSVPFWRTDGALIMAAMYVGPVEFLYYWFHRALHHHFLYTRYHSHHHASIITEPITSYIHPFAEILAYNVLFAIPIVACVYTKTISILPYALYILYTDLMNNMGHCNFEFVPEWLFRWFPPLKYLMYTPSFHSLHHTQVRTNYSLYMPLYDYIYNTMDKSSDAVYKRSLIKGEDDEALDVVHLTHLTDLQSAYHLRPMVTGLASKPSCYNSEWRVLTSFLSVSWLLTMLTWVLGSPLVIERIVMEKKKKLVMQTWAIPRFIFQYGLKQEKEAINGFIEKAIHEADRRGTKVLSLGLLNQAHDLNGSGELYLQKYPELRVRIVDGSSLAAAVVVNSVPPATDQVVLGGKLSKVARAAVVALCKRNVKVIVLDKQDYDSLKKYMPKDDTADNLLHSKTSTAKVWIIGESVGDSEQRRAAEGTTFIPWSQLPPRAVRGDCSYLSTPAMSVPRTLRNVHSCENWLPRRVLSAWRVAGIVHALEGWGEHECGDAVLDMERAWSAAARHGFQPSLGHV